MPRAAWFLIPITLKFHFEVSLAQAQLIGVGNGDPSSHEPDIGTKREAFSGLCMGIVRATKSPGEIMVEVASPGLTAAAATISTRDTTLRPQVEEWKRKVPSGGGVTGLWRPASATGPSGPDPLQLVVAGDTLFTLIQNGSALTGMLEAPGTGFGPGGGRVGGPLEGSVEGRNISFRVGMTTYTGNVNGQEIELRKTTPPLTGVAPAYPPETGAKPVIGPPPNGSDPSLAGFRAGGAQPPMLLRRASR